MKFNKGIAISYFGLILLSMIYALSYWNYYIDITGPAIKENNLILGIKLFPFYEFLELKSAFFATALVLIMLCLGFYYWFNPITKKWLKSIVIMGYIATLFSMSYGPLKIHFGKNDTYTGPRVYSKILDPYSKEQLPDELYLRLELQLWEARALLLSVFLSLSTSIFLFYHNPKNEVAFEEILDN